MLDTLRAGRVCVFHAQARKRATVVTVGDKAPDVTVRDIRGLEVELSSMWRGRTLVLTFLRHFG